MGDINPNTPITNPTTTETGKQVVESGGGPLTFDELESATQEQKAKKRAAPKEEKTEKQEKSQDLTSDDKKGEKSDKKESKPEPKAEKKEAKEKDEPEKPPRKTYKGKYADQEYELDEEAEFLVKTNGKEEPWKLKDLLADKSGRTAWDKKFTEIDKRDKEVKTREQKLTQTSEMIKKMSQEQDPDMRMFYMAQLGGVDPIEYRKQMMSGMEKYVEKYYTMSEAERAAADLAFENKIIKQQHDTLQGKVTQEQADKALDEQINHAIASHKIPEQDFYTKLDYLDQQVRAGKLKPEALSIENAVQLVKADMLWNPAKEALDALKLDWTDSQRGEALNAIVKNALAVGLEPKDIPDVIDEVYGNKNAQRKIKEKQEKNQEFTSGKKEILAAATRNSDATFFSDL